MMDVGKRALATAKRRNRFGSIEVRATWLTLGLFVVVAGLWGIWAVSAQGAPPPQLSVLVDPVFVPAALTSTREIEVEHLEDFADLAGFYADYYSYLAEDEGARAEGLERYALHTPPGDERDRLERRAQTYRDREELNMLRSILALEWYQKIVACANALNKMRTELGL